MILTAQRRRILSAICPTMFEGAGDLEHVRGPRGGLKGYRAGEVTVGIPVVLGLIEDGLIGQDLKITTRGIVHLQDALADAA